MSTPSNITLKLACHCRTFTHTLTIPSSRFPLKSSVCHCTTCRRASGHVFCTFAVIPLPYLADGSPALPTEGLVMFCKTQGLRRWFCGTCGASCWNDDRSSREWEYEVATGVVEAVVGADGVVRLDGIRGLLRRVQMYVGDTRDGGGAVWVNRGVLDGMDRRFEGRCSGVVQDAMLATMVDRVNVAGSSVDVKDHERVLSAKCACERVQLEIRNDGTGKRYSAGIDACESCRKVSGFEITAWATVPVDCISTVGNQKLDPGAQCFGRYKTSENVERTFCTGCGATIFAEIQGRTSIDVAVGILLADEGVRAGSWLKWGKYGDGGVAHMVDAIDKAFVTGLLSGSAAADRQ